VPVVAAVQGRCLGGAFELALACHLVVCAAGAVFACPEVRLGVFPPALAALGPSRLGGALAERLIVTGAELTASQGMSAGFVTETAPEGAEFEAWTSAWVTKNLAPLSAFALRQAVKAARRASGFDRALEATLDQAEAQYLAEVVTSHDGNEGIEAFLAKRPPAWRDA
jgi:enoyl-CoA hydratase/carnithine racemase